MLQQRLISMAEIAVVQAAIQRAPHGAVSAGALASVGALRVTARCDCGYDSIDFATAPSGETARIADGVGTTFSGGRVGILVWATAGEISGLEVYAGRRGERPAATDTRVHRALLVRVATHAAACAGAC